MPALLTLQVWLTFQGEAGFPQLHSWRPKVIQGKAAARGERMCRSSDWGRKSARLELGETAQSKPASDTHTDTLMEKCGSTLTHTHIHTGVRTVRTDSCRDVMCIGLDSLIQAAHTNTLSLKCFSRMAWRVAHSRTLTVQAWQEKHWDWGCIPKQHGFSHFQSYSLAHLFPSPSVSFHSRYIHVSPPGPPLFFLPFCFYMSFLCLLSLWFALFLLGLETLSLN